MRYPIVGISDVSIGYGSPEVPALMHSVCELLGQRGLLIEPDEINRPPLAVDWEPAFDLKRFASRFPDHSGPWHRHYQALALRELERHRPELVIIFGSSVFASLMGLPFWPKRVIYHAYEFISNLPARDLVAHRCLMHKCDLVITPEVQRLIIDCETFASYPSNVAAIYNVADVSYPAPVRRVPAEQRNGRFLWYGTLHRQQAYADYFASKAVQHFQFDLFGRITDPEAGAVAEMLNGTPNVRYFGVVDADELNHRRAENIYSLVWWNPELGPGAYYLASNRFFTSIQAGVPPICGPHPQCIELVERYGCGLIMDDWSEHSFARTLEIAWRIYKTPAYSELVQNCLAAADTSLHWDAQFARLAPRIEAIMSRGR